MTEPSTVNADQVCQANQDCNFSIVGQICLNNECTFSCSSDAECISGGKCIDAKCDWSGESIPPLFPNSTSTQNNLDATNSSEQTTDNKLSSPFIIAIVVVVALVVIFCLAVVLFFVLRRRKLAESSRGLKPLTLNTSRTSIRKKRDSREKDRERSSKKYQHDDDLIGSDDEKGKEEHEDLFTPAAVGHRPPQRSQTMWGTSTPSTVELNVGYPELGQQHHFMQDPYVEMERGDQQQQQHQQQQEHQEQQE